MKYMLPPIEWEVSIFENMWKIFKYTTLNIISNEDIIQDTSFLEYTTHNFFS